ncbi:TonB-dependent receptor [Flavisolibacter tropicus]|uniref:TonB-dependent receptor n=1 Tax=Flavisolibacter tropicus TaxID=1492898 RepID=A0A172U0I6_9BACT|nr:TonB-dependent receptor [Flavisolibacter tropicus]ANE52871.1 TonB-dependent receptor [Flavisolibacter tropicus]
MIRQLSILVISLLWVSVCCGQLDKLKLRGLVQAEGKPLANVTVQVNKQEILTDSLGAFVIDLVTGTYQVKASMVGYEPFANKLLFKADTSFVIELEKTVTALNEVVVTGTMRPVQKLQSPISVEVYTPQFFKKNPTPSIFEALQGVNGIRPQINCNVCNTGDIHINGLEGPYTMITIDGMPIVSSLSSVYGLFGIPHQMIERVEVVKGPASGLYGSEAIGGLINIITKSPERAPRFSANVMTTSWLEHNVDLGTKFQLGKLRSLIGVNYFNYTKPIDKNDDLFTDVTLQHRITVFNKWSLERKANRIASLAARYFYEDRWGGEMNWSKQYRGTDISYGESIYTNRWELIGAYQLPINTPIVLNFSSTQHDQNSYYGTTFYKGEQRISYAQLLWNKDLTARQHLLVGAGGRYNFYDDNTVATFDTLTKHNQPECYFIPALFVQHEWDWRENHTLLTGLRYDHHSVHGSIFTPRIAYKWKVDDKQVVRLNAGTGFRVVNLFTEEHAALTGARAVEVEEELKPETSYNVNLNYTAGFGTASKIFQLDGSVWYTYFHNQIAPDYDSDPNKIKYSNLKGFAVSKGISLSIDANIQQRLKGTIGMTFQDVTRTEEKKGQRIKQRPVLNERWTGTWAIAYTLPEAGITFDYTGNIYGPMRLPLASAHDPRPSTSPVWSLQNIQVTKWIKKGVEVYGGVKNLLNWTPAKSSPFLIARSQDPFDKKLDYNGDGHTDLDANGQVLVTAENPYGLTFDPTYVYGPNQGIRAFVGLRLTWK